MIKFLSKRRFFIVRTVPSESNERKLLFKAKTRADVRSFITAQGKVDLVELNEITKIQFNSYKKAYMTVCI